MVLKLSFPKWHGTAMSEEPSASLDTFEELKEMKSSTMVVGGCAADVHAIPYAGKSHRCCHRC
jgi:hypothetical protein